MPHVNAPQFQQQPLSPAELLDGGQRGQGMDFDSIFQLLQLASMRQASGTVATGGATPEPDSIMDAIMGMSGPTVDTGRRSDTFFSPGSFSR